MKTFDKAYWLIILCVFIFFILMGFRQARGEDDTSAEGIDVVVESGIEITGPTAFVWAGDTEELMLEISWDGGKINVKYNDVTEAAKAFFDYLKQYVDGEYKIVEKDRLKSILERVREFVETYEEPIYDAFQTHDLVYRPPPSRFKYLMDEWDQDIEELKGKKEALERERQLAQEIDALLKELK